MSRKTTKNDEILSPTQLKVIEGLMLGEKLVDLAKRLNVPYDTLWRWTKNEIFVGELNRRKTELVTASQTRLLLASKMAIDTLEEGMKDADPNIRVRCAQTVLSKLPAIELTPVVDWEAKMREKAEILATAEDANDDPATRKLLDSLGVFKDVEKADSHYRKLMDMAIKDLKE